MARSQSSYTASPTRWRSPPRSPTRRSSQDGSQYEMDLDALGLNSTFASTDLEESHKPKTDVVDTSDIDGPEDFTMNMTYWMTADLSRSQPIRSRKEAHVDIAEVRGDAMQESVEVQDTTAEEDKAVSEETSHAQIAELTYASPARRVQNDADDALSKNVPSDASMENDEKVRSYLSALPDTEIGDDALTSTPLRIPRQNLLQVPSPSPSKARSLQPTVEDYDTPRKPTQQTVIHHTPEDILEVGRNNLQKQVEELQSRLNRQEIASKSRISELELLLQYTRADLQAARNETYQHKEQVRNLEEQSENHSKEVKVSCAEMEGRLRKQEEDSNAKMQDFREELGLQNFAKLQTQRDDFERQMHALEETKRAADKAGEEREQLLQHMQSELDQLRKSQEQDLEIAGLAEHPQDGLLNYHLQTKLSSLQSRANSTQADLEKAIVEAGSARKEAEESAALLASAQTLNQTQRTRIIDLEFRLESLQNQLKSAQSNVHSKDRQLQDSADLEERLECLQKQLEDSRADVTAKEKQLLQTRDLKSRMQSLQTQLDATRADAATKDQQTLLDMHAQEQSEHRLNVAQGRVQNLESTVSALRQHLAVSNRDLAKARTDAEQFEQKLGDVNDRLQDVRAEAGRRVADVERKLTKLKESKQDADSRIKELRLQHEEVVEGHESKMEDVRDKAEDAVRKAGSLFDQERSEKKRIARELRKTTHDLEILRAEVANKAAEEEEFSDEERSMLSTVHTDAKDTEIENLRTLLRKQSSTLKTLKSETLTLRRENTRLKIEPHKPTSTFNTSPSTIITLPPEKSCLRLEIDRLTAEAKTREEDFAAVNKAMDERLAAMLSKFLKERARNVVGKRDGQWADSVKQADCEKELMRRVLLREWGRQEVGIAREGEEQGYRYKYARRS